MKENTYQKWNTITGWIVFIISLITYTLTLEPTVSFWDCGEYISTAVKLEVGHPPGAPMYQMLGAFFAMFSFSSSDVAYMVNFMSGLASAFTILFMFWSLTNLIKRISIKNEDLDINKTIAIIGSAAVGSLTYTFSDSFWFSAVEAEVYAMSSFLMALLFWLGLKWEKSFGEPRNNRWLILICLIIGLSFGVHILSLLVIPSLVFLYLNHYYKKYTVKTFIIANAIAIGTLAFIFKFLFPYTLLFFSISELFFINNLGLPFNSGTIIAGIVIIAGFYYGLAYTRKNKLYLGNTVLLAIVFVMIGFSCWLMLPIRANANTIVNENNPSSARELLAYYNREQYGDSNIFYDTYYSEKYNDNHALDANGEVIMEDVKPKYEKDEKAGKYIIVNDYKKVRPKTSSKHKGFIPRMVVPGLEQNYKNIVGIPKASTAKPTFAQNIRFMAEYQFGYMYFRYLFWNFVGKQNDIQGNMDPLDGNWITGINAIDKIFIGTQKKLPSDVLNNKGRNIYFGIPFILGIIGLAYQYRKDKRNFYNLLLFFAFTGFAIIFYTNPKPFEPRERDYAIVGSFYIFAMWVGFGVYAIIDKINEFKINKLTPIVVTAVCLLISPLLMATQNWDDHDRSNKYTAYFNAKSYLDSCDENAILFTIGDNDTFPLWYLQEVEKYRTDIRIINSSLLATDWYIDQMKRKAYESDPIPSQLIHEQYKHGSLDVAYNTGQSEGRWNIDDFMTWISSSNKKTYVETRGGKFEKFYPTNKLMLTVDKETVLANGTVMKKDVDKIVDTIEFDIDKTYLTKNRILMLDILANNKWKKPIYFTGGSNDDGEYIWLKDYLQLDGMTYKLVPIKTTYEDQYGMLGLGRIDSEKMYDKMKNWDFGNHGKDFYLDVESRKNSISYRNNISRLVEILINNGELDKAEEMLDLSYNKLPIDKYLQYGVCLGFPEQYYLVNKPEKARIAADLLIKKFQEQLTYYLQFDPSRGSNFLFSKLEPQLQMYKTVVIDVNRYEADSDYDKKVSEEFDEYIDKLENVFR